MLWRIVMNLTIFFGLNTLFQNEQMTRRKEWVRKMKERWMRCMELKGTRLRNKTFLYRKLCVSLKKIWNIEPPWHQLQIRPFLSEEPSKPHKLLSIQSIMHNISRPLKWKKSLRLSNDGALSVDYLSLRYSLVYKISL